MLTSFIVLPTELAIAWQSGEESFISYRQLRQYCPCARCAGEPDALGRVEPITLSEHSLKSTVLSYQTVGNYAVTFVWSDGHSSGIYSYELLKRIAKVITAN